ncbi:MAG: hypothetical protein K5854_01730 [Prevotella sp.]|nr:hypothetical protein [Prevotella sp.]
MKAKEMNAAKVAANENVNKVSNGGSNVRSTCPAICGNDRNNTINAQLRSLFEEKRSSMWSAQTRAVFLAAIGYNEPPTEGAARSLFELAEKETKGFTCSLGEFAVNKDGAPVDANGAAIDFCGSFTRNDVDGAAHTYFLVCEKLTEAAQARIIDSFFKFASRFVADDVHKVLRYETKEERKAAKLAAEAAAKHAAAVENAKNVYKTFGALWDTFSAAQKAAIIPKDIQKELGI